MNACARLSNAVDAVDRKGHEKEISMLVPVRPAAFCKCGRGDQEASAMGLQRRSCPNERLTRRAVAVCVGLTCLQ